ncbi:hypothetical protein GNI_193440, partial [Gregarina niphandrodes]
MDRVFEGLIGNNVNVYIDHIVAYADDLETCLGVWTRRHLKLKKTSRDPFLSS